MTASDARKRLGVLAPFVIAAIAITAGVAITRQDQSSATTPSPSAPTLGPVTSAPSATASPLHVSASDVTRIYLPSGDPKMEINTVVRPIIQQDRSIPDGDCRTVIEPAVSGSSRTGVFQCTNFASPSTRPAGSVVLAGHQSVDHYWNTVFDHLSCTPKGCGPFPQSAGCSPQRRALVGREVFLQTKTSGRYWFAYKVTQVHCPSKRTDADLAEKEALWKPTAGRLLLVTCLEQQGLNVSASNNLIVQAEQQGISSSTRR